MRAGQGKNSPETDAYAWEGAGAGLGGRLITDSATSATAGTILEPLCHVPFKFCLIELSPKLYKVNLIVISISEIRILRLREVKYIIKDQISVGGRPILSAFTACA